MATTKQGNRKGMTWAHNPATFPLDAPDERTKNVATKNTTTKKSGGRTSAKASKSHKKHHTNPATSTSSNKGKAPATRFGNPLQGIATGGLVVSAIGMAGFDYLAHKILGNQSESVAAATKIGGGFLLLAGGRRIPVIGKHSDMIAKGLILVGVYGLVKVYVMPHVVSYFQPAAPAPAPQQQAAGLAGLRPRRRLVGRPGLGNIPNTSVWRGATR